MGNFNVDMLNQDNNFIDDIISCGIYQTVFKATRVSERSCSLIDNSFTNVTLPGTTSSDSLSGVLLTDLADHFPIFLYTQCKLDVNVHDDTLIRNCSGCDIEKFISDISSTN